MEAGQVISLKEICSNNVLAPMNIQQYIHDICKDKYSGIHRMNQRVIFSYCAYQVYSPHLSATTGPPMSKHPDPRISCLVICR